MIVPKCDEDVCCAAGTHGIQSLERRRRVRALLCGLLCQRSYYTIHRLTHYIADIY